MQRLNLILMTIFVTIQLSALPVHAISEKLTYSLDGSLTFSFNSMSENWNSASTGSLVWISNLNGMIYYPIDSNISNVSILKVGYGQINILDKKSEKWLKPSICSDYINFESIFSFNKQKRINRFLSLTVKSKFVDSRENSFNLNPLTLSGILGISSPLINIKNVKFVMYLGCSLIQTLDRAVSVLDLQTKQTVLKQVETCTGNTELIANFSYKHDPFLFLNCKLSVIQALVNAKKTLNNDWRYPDITIDLSLNLPVISHVNLSYLVQVLYDKEVSSHLRIKQIMGAGLKFKIKNP